MPTIVRPASHAMLTQQMRTMSRRHHLHRFFKISTTRRRGARKSASRRKIKPPLRQRPPFHQMPPFR
jgi:hypothetical protein